MWNVHIIVSGNIAYGKPVEIPDQSSKGSASMTVDGGLKDSLHLCVHLRNTDPEYSWKVDLKQLYDIEQFIVNGNPSGEYRQN